MSSLLSTCLPIRLTFLPITSMPLASMCRQRFLRCQSKQLYRPITASVFKYSLSACCVLHAMVTFTEVSSDLTKESAATIEIL